MGKRTYLFQKGHILTVPNLLSFLRILMIPLILWLYIGRSNYLLAAAVVLLSGITDVADGYIARTFHMVSDLGKVLDPIADKLTQAALVICLVTRYRWMLPVLVLLVIREIMLGICGMILLTRHGVIDGAKWYGKLSTAVVYISMMILILDPSQPAALLTTLIVLCCGVILFSCIQYASFYYRLFRGQTETSGD